MSNQSSVSAIDHGLQAAKAKASQGEEQQVQELASQLGTASQSVGQSTAAGSASAYADGMRADYDDATDVE